MFWARNENHGRFVFDVAIYQEDEDTYQVWRQREEDKFVDWVKSQGADDEIVGIQLHYNYRKRLAPPPWRFNQAIGWIRLWASDPTEWASWIGGQLWFVDGRKRLGHDLKRKKQYMFEDDALDVPAFPPDCTSAHVFAEIMSALDRFPSKSVHITPRWMPRLKRAHIDLEALRAVGPSVNWRGVIGFDRQLQITKRS
jgi:hypothetical protein